MEFKEYKITKETKQASIEPENAMDLLGVILMFVVMGICFASIKLCAYLDYCSVVGN